MKKKQNASFNQFLLTQSTIFQRNSKTYNGKLMLLKSYLQQLH